nr:glycosyltransferase [Streptomyces sp. SID13031]
MPQVDLAITTGGQGSVQTAMASGTPLLGIPLHIEQDLNVALVERLGAARHATPTDNLATLAAQMLDNRSHAAAAERIQKLYAAVDGPAQAAEAIALAAPETS